MVDHQWLPSEHHVTADVEKSRPGWSAEKFASGGRKHIAADRLDIDGHLADGLARVQKITDIVLSSDPADIRDRACQSAVGRNPADRDQLDPSVNHSLKFDDITGTLRNLQERDIIGGVLSLGREYTTAWLKQDRVECHLPRDRGILRQRGLTRRGIEKTRDLKVNAVKAIRAGVDCRLAADRGFLIEGIRCRLHHQRRRK